MSAQPNSRSFKTPPAGLSPVDGVLLVDKPPGPTSHDVVAKIRKKFKIKKVGHGGTLDPQATGLLVILLGRGTKLANSFTGADKAYEGAIRLGVATDSQDAQGKVISEGDYSNVTKEMLEAEMRKFTGDLLQKPPMVSAVKVGGVPLYKHARKGKTVEREPKLVHVYEFTLRDFDPPSATFFLRCTKGTYVRTLCADIGENLGCGAHLEQLRRTRSGDFDIDSAEQLDAVLELSTAELVQRIIPISRVVNAGSK